MDFKNVDIKKYSDNFFDWIVEFTPKFILALLVLWIGMKVAKKLGKLCKASIGKAGIDREIEEFLGSILDFLLKATVIIVAASIVGVKFTFLIGLIAAAGFAIGMALQGFLGNFASGLYIIFFKPYKVGDWVKINDSFGNISSIQIFSTILITPGDKTLVIPNGQITDNAITNFSTQGKIRIELTVTMPYEESFPKVKEIILATLRDLSFVDQEPAPMVGIESYDSHNIVVAIRPYISPDHYWDATFEVYAAVKSAFRKNNIQVAYSEGVELGNIGD